MATPVPKRVEVKRAWESPSCNHILIEMRYFVRGKRVEIQTNAMLVTFTVLAPTELSALSNAAVKQWSVLLSPFKTEVSDVMTTSWFGAREFRTRNVFRLAQTILEE